MIDSDTSLHSRIKQPPLQHRGSIFTHQPPFHGN